MPISLTVTNNQPESCEDVPQPLLDLFQDFAFHRDGKRYYPFVHQAEAFRIAGVEQKSLFLEAGTASGKTLAIAIPLFWKLKQGLIKKALLMYPTVALLEDQKKVMETLAEITGLQIGQLHGGMSRSKLIEALNRPVILATPDEIYWFFRKNVKYSSLLIYGLAQVDEFVLDEGHLFSGLMLRNLAHLKKRMQLLGEKIGKTSRWHILTATPTEELRRLIDDGVEIKGQSKCSDVETTFLEPVKSYKERQEKMIGAVESAVSDGASKVLLVFNSADLAHRVFEGIRGKASPEIPVDIKLRFGRIRWDHLKAWLEEQRIGKEQEEQIKKEIERWLLHDEPIYLNELTPGSSTELSAEVLAANVAKLLENQAWIIKKRAYSAQREGKNSQIIIDSMDGWLGGKNKLARLIWASIKREVSASSPSTLSAGAANEIDGLMHGIDAWCSNIQGRLEKALESGRLTITAPEFEEIKSVLSIAGMGEDLAAKFRDFLKYSIEIPEEDAVDLKIPSIQLSKRYVSFSWLSWLIKDDAVRKDLTERIYKALAEGRLQADTKNIATWGETDTPVIIYTGKMSRNERKGLLDAFSILPRAILISTPAVEVGVDFAADTLITEQCDGNGFLQRFGRVGRRAGVTGKVVVLVKDGDTYVKLFNLLEGSANTCTKTEMSREEFSSMIASSEGGIFPAKSYAEGSDFLDATHWLVNSQIGEIGGWLNQQMFQGSNAEGLALQIRKSGLPFAYGLRGTMPGISLQGGAGGGDPFYMLRKIYNDHLMPSDSPFDMARADMWHMELLWKKSQWKIVVDAAATLEASQAIFWQIDGCWHLKTGYGIAADYARLFEMENNLISLKKSYNEITNVLRILRPHAEKPHVKRILKLEDMLPLFFSTHAKFVLGMGDVYLQRQDPEGIVEPVEDRMGSPLVLPNQVWLILFGSGKEQSEAVLDAASAMNLEELIYDLQTLEVQGSRVTGPVILEKIAGACFDVYRRLAENAG